MLATRRNNRHRLNPPPQGPYKQYMGRSKNTGNLVVVLYEDPPDGIPKIHIRSSKYMAWIAENQLPVHMHVEKVIDCLMHLFMYLLTSF